MKLALDESVLRRLASSFPTSFTVRTAQSMSWAGAGNGLLLSLAAGEDFDALLTVDRGIEHQQNVSDLPHQAPARLSQTLTPPTSAR